MHTVQNSQRNNSFIYLLFIFSWIQIPGSRTIISDPDPASRQKFWIHADPDLQHCLQEFSAEALWCSPEFPGKLRPQILIFELLSLNYENLINNTVLCFSVFRIRMDPGVFADLYPDFKNPDPSINKPMGSEWCFCLGFRVTSPKRTVLSAKYEIKNLSTRTYSLRTFFFMDPDFSGLDPDFWLIRNQEKKFDPDPKH